MNYLSSVQSKIITLFTPEDKDLAALRERILNGLLSIGSTLGLIALGVNILPAIRDGLWGIVAAYGLSYSVMLFITLYRRLPYKLRAGVIVIIPYLLAIVDIVKQGVNGDGLTWLFASALLASILLGLKWGLGVWALDLASLTVFGYLITSGRLIIVSQTNILSSNIWVEVTLGFMLLSGVIAGSLAVLIGGLDRSLKSTQQLTTSLEEERIQLRDRSLALERRLIQIRAAAEISHTVSAVLDPETLLQMVVELLRERFRLHYVGAFVLDEDGKNALLRAGTGAAGRKMLGEAFMIEINSLSAIGWAIENREARVALTDEGESNLHTPETRSELAIPIKTGERVLGALTIHSEQTQAFDKDDIIVFEGIGDSLGTALENASLIQETRRLAENERLVASIASRVWTSTDIDTILRTSVRELGNTLRASEGYIRLELGDID